MVADTIASRLARAEQSILLRQGEQLAAMPPRLRECSIYNLARRDCRLPQRWCPHCDKRFDVSPEDASGRDREREEAHRSGICTEDCFIALNGIPLWVQDHENDRPGRAQPDVRASTHAYVCRVRFHVMLCQLEQHRTCKPRSLC